MSYPNKETPVDKKSETVESPGQETKEKSSPSETKEMTRLPVGKLKWSKDEEEEQDIELILAKSKKNEAVSPKKEDGNESSTAGVAGNSPKSSPKEDADPLSKPQGKAGLAKEGETPQKEVASSAESTQTAKRELTIEDTLTPIDFKEYLIDPKQTKSEEQAQFKTEVKKPVFQAEPLPKKEESNAKAEKEEPKSKEQKEKPKVKEKTKAKEKPSVQDKRFGEDAKEDKKSSSQNLARIAKILWFPVTIVVVLIVGFIIGHTVIGDQPAGDLFNMSMWNHIYDLLFTK
ncbi:MULTISPECIES: DNA-directed RNA polymerase subunit beta [Thermoactinomyces]|uniref:DNA-directed RNA polymerase subunit beta n=1 Tax=Thermoactinomyces daqus TaxID=1329516 RepID=A0A7W2AGM6_9BACL|nr:MULTISPECIES: DNA-directed RNA polymerase subunit beta [Thermoactinomyces]MBA4541816.1 DNA-directed RNA polymerase subunit beta [Thermoactinomyces daqus]MBH8597813.1 DNA-directed RNA polymerase subunit beta [Thermoactinomyces sp. CICC 10523]MBH8604164.1 DNA-directed RNA polymerase subunit beta [Thermoactinomyces sp. CICC 10522]MBH8608114.1 DNA-directed RNA polymerase subunit beta [Thermoactinomyces sp. CICC 10521]